MVKRSNSLNSRGKNGLGSLLVVFALLLFATQDAVIKSLSADYAVLQIVFLRSLSAFLLLLVFVGAAKGIAGLSIYKPWPLILRSSFSYFAYLFYYLAIAALPLAETATITFLSPVIVTVLCAVFLQEQVGKHRWGAVLVGFLAIVMVVGPQGSFGNPAVIFALMAAFAYAIAIVLTRYLDDRDSALTCAFYSGWVFVAWTVILSVLVLLVFQGDSSANPSVQFLTRSWVTINNRDLYLLLSLGALVAVGLVCLIKAYRIADISAVAPFEYSYIVWSVLFGFLFWNESPSTTTFVGIGLLIASNLYILKRELKSSKQ